MSLKRLNLRFQADISAWIDTFIHLINVNKITMENLDIALNQLIFKWLPRHLNHIAENIVFKKRNISFLSINALFRLKHYEKSPAPPPFKDSFMVHGFVEIQQNDLLRQRAEHLTVVFKLDNHNNIIPITAYSESDDN